MRGALTLELYIAAAALIIGFAIWRHRDVRPRRFATALMFVCCIGVIGGSCVQGGWSESGWQKVFEAAMLLNALVYFEILRTLRRERVPIAVVVKTSNEGCCDRSS